MSEATPNADATQVLQRVPHERAALRRIATLVSREIEPCELFAVVAEEVGRVVDAPLVAVSRYESADTAIVCGTFPAEGAFYRTGDRVPLDGVSVLARIRAHGEPARIDDYSELPGKVAELARTNDIGSGVGVPIVVGGDVWGSIVAWSTERLPEDFESRLAEFTELLAGAITTAEATQALAELADEQAALRRVATLVAEGATTTTLAASVLDEAVAALDVPAGWLIRYEAERTMSILAAVNDPTFPIGSQWPLEGTSVSSAVFKTGRSARIDDFTGLQGSIAERSRESEFRSSLGAPILVDGTVWGAICVGTTAREPLAAGTEDRLGRFTELFATAISNADARDHLHGLADEQAALRRVATLVAHDAPATKVMDAVAAEVGELLDADLTVLGRYDDDGAATALGSWSSSPQVIPVGTRSAIGGRNVLSMVAETGVPARLDSYEDATGEAADIARAFGWRSSIAAPITVAGRVWGVMLVATQRERPFPAGDEERLAQFTDLVATAVANAQSREAEREFGEDQAALGRVATLVAGGVAPEQVFEAVVEEASRLLSLERIELVRYEGEDTGVVMAASGDHPFPPGSTWSLQDPSVMATVARTGSATRIDDYSALDGEIAEAARGAGFQSAIGAPVTVEGRLWGVVIAISTDPEPIPERSESRLGQFTELVATAVANAEARDALARIAEEQAALRRVATLVATGIGPEELFTAVADEVHQLFDADISGIERFESQGTAVVTVGAHDRAYVGRRHDITPGFIVDSVWQTKRAARFDTDETQAPDMPAIVREFAANSIVACPIVVEGEVWGYIIAATLDRSLPSGIEVRLADFTELVATAVANTEARDGRERIGREQAALRRVATLVAAGTAPDQLFAAVAAEVQELLGVQATGIVRFEGDHTAVTVGTYGTSAYAAGQRHELHPNFAVASVRETSRAARFETDDPANADMPTHIREAGIRSFVANPIVVEGELWGAMLVASRASLPPATEERLASFTELVATAIANSESRNAVARLADEQAALRRVATLVAKGPEPAAVFSAVGEEISRMLDAPMSAVGRFEPGADGTSLVIVGIGTGDAIETGSRWRPEDLPPVAQVLREERSVRMDEIDWSAGGPVAEVAQRVGVISIVASPIFVEGHLWGVMTACDMKRLPLQAQERLEKFSELVATAIGNAESREAREQIAREQAALRRVATLVAEDAPPDMIFAAVTDEVAAIFSSITAIQRFDDDGPAVVFVGVSEGVDIAVGERWEFAEGMASAEVYRTGRSARLDGVDWASVTGPASAAGAQLALVCQVHTPIVVNGRLWGCVSVNGREKLPPETEQQLENFTELVATAIANAESRSELAASRRRIVAAADEARRRIERDLHDGIQQRLIALTFRARSMTRKPAAELPLIAEELSDDLKDLTDELREVSRGIHPTILTEAGLGPALRALARRSDIPIHTDVRLHKRLPASIEAAAYYIASEALTNVARHAHASVVELTASRRKGALTLCVHDDGVGGVEAGRGSGVVGLIDRVEALGGTISIASPPNGGTTLTVGLPITEPTTSSPGR